jgi:hypothetical protein
MEDRQRQAGGSFGIIARRQFVGYAILCWLAFLCRAATLAAGGAAPSAGNVLPTCFVHGTVVDEKGMPVPHVKVITSAIRESDPDPTDMTDVAGHFTLRLSTLQMQAALLARDESGSRIGSLRYLPGKTRPAARIVLHPARTIPVSVVDGKGRPIAGAKVGVVFVTRDGPVAYLMALAKFLRERTDSQGQAVLHLPADGPLECVWTVKAGAGFDYVLYRTPADQGPKKRRKLPDPAKRAPDGSRPIEFVLSGVHKLRVHVVNERHRPLPGIRIHTSYVERPHKGGWVSLAHIEEFTATADATGMAQFDAIPIEALPTVGLQQATVGYFIWGNATFDPAEPLSDVTVVATELPVLRAKVTYADGRPALGAWVHLTGNQYGLNRGAFAAGLLCELPGEMVVHAFQGDSYCVMSATIEGYASKLEARVARMGEPVRPVHLVLLPATRIHGTLTVGKDRRPAANEEVTLIQFDRDNYAKLPEDERLPRTVPLADLAHVAMHILFRTTTDEHGQFTFEAAPGPYILGAGAVYMNQIMKSKDVKELFPDGAHEFEIKDQKEIVIDLHCKELPSATMRRALRSKRATDTKSKTGS